MTVQDWRDADAALVQRLYSTERRRWAADLAWDTSSSWSIVEEGRSRGHVPGWLLRAPDGTVHGWAYYILHDGELQIGGIHADRAADYRTLLDHVLDSPEASLAHTVSVFVYPAPPSLLSALTRRRFLPRRSVYLVLPLERPAVSPPPADDGLAPFGPGDLAAASRLLASAYDGVSGVECFAPHGRPEEWARYLRQLMETPACGTWQATSSFVRREPGSFQLDGLIVATTLSAETSHIAQVAVAPASRAKGLGRRLVNAVSRIARQSGHRQVTLMVDEHNHAARDLYARCGFVERTFFVSARRRGQVRMSVVGDRLQRVG